MVKDKKGLYPIGIGEMFLQLISWFIILQLWGSFQEHLSPHQFGVSTPKGCETILFGIKTLLDLHPNWIVMQIDVVMAFLESFEMLRDLQRALSPLSSCVMVLIFLFTTNMGNMRKGHHYWIIFKHEARWPLKWTFIFPSPLSNTPKNHCVIPQLCFSIPNEQYPHRGPYKQSCSYLWPPFHTISPSWA
jgi:hypothetical protein